MRYRLLVNFNHFLHILALLCIPLAYLPYVVAESAVTRTDGGILVKGVPRNASLQRFKRMITPQESGFEDIEKEALLRTHNYLRSLVKAGNMMRLEWDIRLEGLAQNHAGRCIFEHSKQAYRTNKAGFNFIGENLYAGTEVFESANVVKGWYKEVADYNNDTKSCAYEKECGHYTQVVWAETRAVGCGYKYCSPLSNTGFPIGYFVVCHYGEAGNLIGKEPYMTGKVCSACPKETRFCTQNLCSTSSSPIPFGIDSGCNNLNANNILLLSLALILCILF